MSQNSTWREHLLGLEMAQNNRSTASSQKDGRESYGILSHYSEWRYCTNAKTLNSHFLSPKRSMTVTNANKLLCTRMMKWNDSRKTEMTAPNETNRLRTSFCFMKLTWHKLETRGYKSSDDISQYWTHYNNIVQWHENPDNIVSGLWPF